MLSAKVFPATGLKFIRKLGAGAEEYLSIARNLSDLGECDAGDLSRHSLSGRRRKEQLIVLAAMQSQI
jgi:hypothetical protein